METRRKKRMDLGKKTLPGDRRGVPGADAGHSSIQTIGDSDLIRRDAVGQPEDNTAELNRQTTTHTQTLLDITTQNDTNPALDALQEQPVTTKAGKPRQRMQWTQQMNRTVMRCYYTATKIETIKSGYRPEMHRIFIANYPQLQGKVTEQRLIDQKRTILTNNRIPPHELQTIKETVAQELRTQTQTTNNATDAQSPPQEHQPIRHNSPQRTYTPTTRRTIQTTQQTQEETPGQTQHTNTTETQATLQTNIHIWRNSNPTKRIKIPRLTYKRDTANIINTINELTNTLHEP